MVSAQQIVAYVQRFLDEEKCRLVLERVGIEIQVGIEWIRWSNGGLDGGGATTVSVETGERRDIRLGEIRGIRIASLALGEEGSFPIEVSKLVTLVQQYGVSRGKTPEQALSLAIQELELGKGPEFDPLANRLLGLLEAKARSENRTLASALELSIASLEADLKDSELPGARI